MRSAVASLLRSLLCVVAAAAVFAACSSGTNGGQVFVLAATSLIDVLEELRPAIEESEGIELVVSYGGSQMLAQQIAQGAPADLFIPAGEAPVRLLAERGLAGAARPLASNELVAVTRMEGPPIESMEHLAASDAVGRVAIADPELSPAGAYARESLVNLRLWDRLLPKLVFGADVRVALAHVEAGNVDAALVYRTDAMASGGLRLLDLVPSDSYQTILYPAVPIRGSDGDDIVARLLDHLQSAPARELFARQGFLPPP